MALARPLGPFDGELPDEVELAEGRATASLAVQMTDAYDHSTLFSPSTVREIGRLLVTDRDGRAFLAACLAPVIAGLALLGVAVAVFGGR